jgi:tRNA threonylcarbamoyladenosine biosynthesis protein TsaE
MRLQLADITDTDALGAALAAVQPERAIVYLSGDLGAGKSTLARAWLRSLGVTGAIRSPTYTLVEHYALPGGALALHLDLYRIAAAGDLEFLALDNDDARLWLVEWPERGEAALPPPDLRVDLAVSGDGRVAELAAASPGGRAWLARMTNTGVCDGFLARGDRKASQPTDK